MFALEFLLSNAVIATLLALAASAVGRVTSRPQVIHALWVLVLVKLISPPLVRMPLPFRAAAGVRPSPTHVHHQDRDGDDWQDRTVSAMSFPDQGTLERRGDVAGAEQPTEAGVPGRRAVWLGVLLTWGAGSVAWWGLALIRLGRFER